MTAEGLVESALDKVHIIEDLGYDNLVISIKSSDVQMCARAHELIVQKTRYPLHVGITEAGTSLFGKYQVSHRTWDHFISGYRRYDTCISHRSIRWKRVKSAKLYPEDAGS